MGAERMVTDLAVIAAGHASGLQAATAIPRLTIWRSDEPTDPTPAMFEPKVYVLLQGAKRLAIGGRTFEVAAGGFAVSSVGLPFTGRVTEASAEVPYLGVELRLDAGMIASLLLDMPDLGKPGAPSIAVARAG